MIKRSRLLLVHVIGVLVAACSDGRMSVGDLGGVDASKDGTQGGAGVGGAPGSTTGMGAGGAGASAGDGGAGGSEITDSGAGDGPPAAIVCGGVTCGPGQDCCLLDGRCFDVTDATACPKPPDFINGSGVRVPGCGANTHCDSDETCERAGYICLGPGFCTPRTSCGLGRFDVCGCNGVTYPDVESACAAGTRSLHSAGCGQTPFTVDAAPGAVLCGLDSQCPSGSKCCAITGRCYEATRPGLCVFPPAGSSIPCLDDSDCSLNARGDFGTCVTGCTGGPGGCAWDGGSGCEGAPPPGPVCGCDGKNYVNANCAYSAKAGVRHAGDCSDAAAPDAN